MTIPEFIITDDNGKKKLYVNGYNIWTLTNQECTRDVLEAVMHAYFLGVRDMHYEISCTKIDGDLQCDFKKA